MLTDVSLDVLTKSSLITFKSIVPRLGYCGSLLFALFRVTWVIPKAVGDTLLGVTCPLLAKNGKRLGRYSSFISFGWFRGREIRLLLISE